MVTQFEFGHQYFKNPIDNMINSKSTMTQLALEEPTKPAKNSNVGFQLFFLY
jgi:hypothetical protein